MSVVVNKSCRVGRRAARPGFSLVELVVVIAIVCIIAAIAMPRYAEASGRYRIEAATRRLMSDIAFTQARARARSLSQSMTFYVGSGRFQFVSLSDPDRPTTTYTVDLGLDPYRSQIRSASFGASGTTLTFNGFGVPTRGGSVVLEAGGLSKTIAVDADTGNASGL